MQESKGFSGTRLAIAVLTVLVWCHPAAGAGGESVQAAQDQRPGELEIDDLIWSGSDRASVVFIPRKMLREDVLAELPVRPGDRMLFREAVDRARKINRSSCPSSHEVFEQGTAEDPESLEAFISFFKASFVGEVWSVELGWSPWRVEVGDLVTLRVVEEVHSKVPDAPRPGEIVSIFIPGGGFIHDGVLLCDPPHEQFHRPRVGDRVLAVGSTWADPRFFSAAAIFPVQEGLVIPQPFPELDAHAIPRPLELIRTQVRDELHSPAVDR